MGRNNGDFQSGSLIPQEVQDWRTDTKIGHKRSVKRGLRLYTEANVPLSTESNSSKETRSYAYAIQQELATNSVTNSVPLYRGASSLSHVNSLGAMSFSENKETAERFAKNSGGKVYVAHPGTVKGIRVKNYLPDHMFSDENEWLVHESHAKKAVPLT